MSTMLCTIARRLSDTPAVPSRLPAGSLYHGLRVSDPNDASEREADRMAAEVLSGGGESKRHWSVNILKAEGAVHRKCSCGSSGGSSGPCEECQQTNAATLQRKANTSGGSGSVPSIVHEVLRSPGRRLDAGVRAFFEPRFHHDLSLVRIHTDEFAARSARSVNAEAYTVGANVVFNSGRFDPATQHGKRLLAHELTHVIQQGAGEARDPPPSAGRVLHRQEAPGQPGSSQNQGGPDWGLSCDSDGCKLNTPAGDVPLSKDRYRCYALSVEGRCPPECEKELKEIGFPCRQGPKAPAPMKPGPEAPPLRLPSCPPGQIPYEGGCLPTRRPSTQSATHGADVPGRGQADMPPLAGIGGGHVAFGTIESETLDNFALNESTVPAQYGADLDHLASLLNVYGEVEVHIEGHTDASGTEAINTPLSRARAEAIKSELVSRGVTNPTRLKTQGLSSHQPRVPSAGSSTEQPKNRRVEVWFHIAPSKSSQLKMGP